MLLSSKKSNLFDFLELIGKFVVNFVFMKRKVTQSLIDWKNSPRRMPLIINGARQVGKTYIIEEFGKEHYENVVYMNMEIETNLCQFIETEMSPKKIGCSLE